MKKKKKKKMKKIKKIRKRSKEVIDYDNNNEQEKSKNF